MNSNEEAKIQSSEDYLERILMLSKKYGNIRSIDLVRDLNFSKPSVSIALKKLHDEGFVKIDDKGYITLSTVGRDIAERVFAKHQLLTSFFVKLGINEEDAENEACSIEHHLSDESYEALKKYYIEKMNIKE